MSLRLLIISIIVLINIDLLLSTDKSSTSKIVQKVFKKYNNYVEQSVFEVIFNGTDNDDYYLFNHSKKMSTAIDEKLRKLNNGNRKTESLIINNKGKIFHYIINIISIFA